MTELYIGVVENNLDPKKQGRVQIRIPQIHGNNPEDITYTPTTQLPWSMPCTPGFTGYDMGSFIIPPVGCYMWVVEAKANPSFFVYLGGTYGIGATQPKVMNVLNPENPEHVSMGEYTTPVGVPERAADFNLPTYEYGQSGVLFKSQKGHTIRYTDQDGAESFEFIDRSGQAIRFVCPVTPELNKGNAARRGESGTQSNGTIIIESANKSGKSNTVVTINDDYTTIRTPKCTIDCDYFEVKARKSIDMQSGGPINMTAADSINGYIADDPMGYSTIKKIRKPLSITFDAVNSINSTAHKDNINMLAETKEISMIAEAQISATSNTDMINLTAQKDISMISQSGDILMEANKSIIGNAQSEITLNAQGEVTINTPLTIALNSSSVEITGDVSVQKTINANGVISSSSDVTAGGISLKSHTHGGVESGGDSTGSPE